MSIAEQRRIVFNVEQLMILVGKMETKFATARNQGTRLLIAVVSKIPELNCIRPHEHR